jgi:hypothetical protein
VNLYDARYRHDFPLEDYTMPGYVGRTDPTINGAMEQLVQPTTEASPESYDNRLSIDNFSRDGYQRSYSSRSHTSGATAIKRERLWHGSSDKSKQNLNYRASYHGSVDSNNEIKLKSRNSDVSMGSGRFKVTRRSSASSMLTKDADGTSLSQKHSSATPQKQAHKVETTLLSKKLSRGKKPGKTSTRAPSSTPIFSPIMQTLGQSIRKNRVSPPIVAMAKRKNSIPEQTTEMHGDEIHHQVREYVPHTDYSRTQASHPGGQHSNRPPMQRQKRFIQK